MEIFSWNPQIDLSVDFEDKVREIAFGDGYEQVAPDGLNSLRQNLSNMRFTDYEDEEVKAIKAFFLRHGFSKAFKLDIRGYSMVVRFQSFRIIEKGALVQEITASMKEVFR